MMETDKDLIKQKNSLNTLRFVAALDVMLQHMAEYYVLPDWLQWIHTLVGLIPGVPLFFMLSGYLIWHSIETSGSFPAYFRKRIFRIYPELWIAVILEVFSLVMIYDQSVPAADLLLFTFGQATVFQFWKPESVTGYGCGTPNGSLWTIPVFVSFYVVVWWLHKLLHNKSRQRWGGMLIVSVLSAMLIPGLEGRISEISYKLLRFSLVPNLYLFIIGMLSAEYVRRMLPVLKKYWYLFLLTAVLVNATGLDFLAGYYLLLYSLLLFLGCLGFSYRVPGFCGRVDISYGLYVYHMPIVNALLTLCGNEAPWLIPFSIFMTVLLACLSYLLLQKLMIWLRRKHAL